MTELPRIRRRVLIVLGVAVVAISGPILLREPSALDRYLGNFYWGLSPRVFGLVVAGLIWGLVELVRWAIVDWKRRRRLTVKGKAR